MNRIKTLALVLLAMIAMAGLAACQQEELDAPLDTGPEAVEPGGPDEEALTSVGVDRLGIEGANLIPEIAEAQGLPANQKGVLVQRVVPASPAAEAGLRAGDQPLTVDGQEVLIGGDVIIGFTGQHVDNLQDLGSYLRIVEPTRPQTLTVLRNGTVTELEVALGDLPEVEEP
jgi:S1-C subfamily serine protease